MISQILRLFDLSPKEKRIFEVVRKSGTQPASNVSRITDIPRNSVRFVLDALVEKGLLTKNVRVNTQYYTVERPESIIRHIKIKQARINDKFETQIKLIKDFGADINPHSRTVAKKPKITFHEGRDGLERVYEHTLTTHTFIRSWGNFEGIHDVLPRYFKTYYERRVKRKIFIQVIHPDTEMAREKKKDDSKEMRESVLIDPEKGNWIPEIQVYDNFVNIASWHEKLGILIESPEIAQAMKSVFDLSYEAAKKNQKERAQKGKKKKK